MACKKFIFRLFRNIDCCFLICLCKCNKNHNIFNKILTDVIYNCDLFIAIISKAYLLSPNYDELMYANSIGKRCILIYVSEIHDSMNEILRLRFNRTQSIFKYKYKENDQFAKELIACSEIVRCMTLPFDPIE